MNNQAKVITTWSPKGGCGKSTISQALFKLLGLTHVVAAMDIDPQADLTHRLLSSDNAHNITYSDDSIYQIYKDFLQPRRDQFWFSTDVKSIRKNGNLQLLLKGDIESSMFEGDMVTALYLTKWMIPHYLPYIAKNLFSLGRDETGAEFVLNNNNTPIVLLDTNPAPTITNGFCVMLSDALIVPLDAIGAEHTLHVFAKLCEEFSKNLSLLGDSGHPYFVPKKQVELLAVPIKSDNQSDKQLSSIRFQFDELRKSLQRSGFAINASTEDIVFYADKECTWLNEKF